MLEDAGQFMTRTVIPMRFAAAGAAWGGQKWAPVKRGGTPLWNHGHLAAANSYTVEGDQLTVGNERVQARLQNRGGPLAGQKPSAGAQAAAHAHYKKSFNPRAKTGSVGWMYVKERAFMYWGDPALAAIRDRWLRRIRTAMGSAA